MSNQQEYVLNAAANEIIEKSVRELSRKFAGIFDEITIRPIVIESYASFEDAKVRTFVP
ncbi:MAG: hypothetical protein RIR38_488, partial [Actinomycetota bacterium]